jgi:hypothetical protein
MRALRKGAVAARLAGKARHVMMQRDPVSDSELPQALSHPDDCSGGFVPENARRRDRPVLDLLDIGGANPASSHAHQQLAGPNRWHGERFYPEIIHAAVHDRAHLFGNSSGVGNTSRIHDLENSVHLRQVF